MSAHWSGLVPKLRDALNLRARITGSAPCERDVRGRRFAFYDWCAQNDDIPELVTLARTISRWEDQIVAAVLTGVSNARSESLNRIAKLEARQADSFRNPANQRRRVRTACTRGRSRPGRTAIRRSRLVTGRPPDPGNFEEPVCFCRKRQPGSAPVAANCVRMTTTRLIEISDRGSYERIIMKPVGEVLDSRQRLAPQLIFRQYAYLPADGCSISATHTDCLR
jgi:hypothetical protein